MVMSSVSWGNPGREVFFFPAETGIRDGHVTGVQTCALPISEPQLAATASASAAGVAPAATTGVRKPRLTASVAKRRLDTISGWFKAALVHHPATYSSNSALLTTSALKSPCARHACRVGGGACKRRS